MMTDRVCVAHAEVFWCSALYFRPQAAGVASLYKCVGAAFSRTGMQLRRIQCEIDFDRLGSRKVLLLKVVDPACSLSHHTYAHTHARKRLERVFMPPNVGSASVMFFALFWTGAAVRGKKSGSRSLVSVVANEDLQGRFTCHAQRTDVIHVMMKVKLAFVTQHSCSLVFVETCARVRHSSGGTARAPGRRHARGAPSPGDAEKTSCACSRQLRLRCPRRKQNRSGVRLQKCTWRDWGRGAVRWVCREVGVVISGLSCPFRPISPGRCCVPTKHPATKPCHGEGHFLCTRHVPRR